MANMSVEKIITVGLAIKEAAETARRNKKECRDIERSVARVGALLSLLNESTTMAETMKHPAMSGPLEDLAESVEEALELVTDCQEKNALRRFVAAGGVAKKLRRVQDDILRKMMLGTFATTTLMSITLASTTIVGHDSAHHRPAKPQDAGEVVVTHSSHSTIDDASGRSGVSSNITKVPTGSKVPYAPTSRLTESTLSELKDTAHHLREENVTGGGGHSKYRVLDTLRLQELSYVCSKR
ncbi:hypothetical protein ACP70R_008744 [Stipagrostis hirtigluma subsp. patula]